MAKTLENNSTRSNADSLSVRPVAKSKEEITKRRLFIGIPVAAVAIVAAIFVGQFVVHQIAYANYSAKVAELKDVNAKLDEDLQTMRDNRKIAIKQFASTKDLLDVAKPNPDFFEPASTLETLEAKNKAFGKIANISVADDGKVSAAEIKVADSSKAGLGLTQDNSTAELNAASNKIAKTIVERNKIRDGFMTYTKKLNAANRELIAAQEAVAKAGAKSGKKFERPEKASQESWDAYQKALEDLTKKAQDK